MTMNNPITLEHTDSDLVKKVKESDEVAYYHLYERYASKIYHVSRKMELSHHDAEEVVQEVFLYLWKKRNELRSDLSINAYIFSIVRSLVINRCQKKARFTAFQQYSVPMNKDFSNVTEDTVIYRDLHAYASKAIDTLPVKQREVFIMKTVNHMTAEEIAAQLNLSVRTVENQLYRATKSLRHRFNAAEEVPFGLILMLLGLIS
ncbi:RNA polymerase sigma-70 factor, expansion family 1 [Echinicola vietnamensis DSM 17526]|uniref:RNA polymerase sigma-70 factor, expansion family 1 n=2 Tax=Echinicola TaxID=390846 RepID=L0G4E9_ECHVK|nr:RNA polymerase sigma-70 factor, expansion family 1 [Echinicola vietnamensis DSM 17526]